MMIFTLQGNVVYLEDIQLMMILGVFPEERLQRQEVEVSIAIRTKVLDQVTEDLIASTYNYAGAYDLAMSLSEHSFELVEYFATTLAEKILASSPLLEAVEVIVGKKGAFVNAKRVGCRILRHRA